MLELAEASLLLGAAVLQTVGVSVDRADALLTQFRQNAYSGLKRLTDAAAA